MFLTPKDFVEPTPPTPFKYLTNGDAYPVRPEPRGQRVYWFMRKMRNGQSATIYLAPHGLLSKELIDNAVIQIDAELNTQDSEKAVQS